MWTELLDKETTLDCIENCLQSQHEHCLWLLSTVHSQQRCKVSQLWQFCVPPDMKLRCDYIWFVVLVTSVKSVFPESISFASMIVGIFNGKTLKLYIKKAFQFVQLHRLCKNHIVKKILTVFPFLIVLHVLLSWDGFLVKVILNNNFNNIKYDVWHSSLKFPMILLFCTFQHTY